MMLGSRVSTDTGHVSKDVGNVEPVTIFSANERKSAEALKLIHFSQAYQLRRSCVGELTTAAHAINNQQYLLFQLGAVRSAQGLELDEKR